VCAHLYREGLEAHQTKVVYQLANGHVQRTITWRGGRQRGFEVGEVLDFGVKLQVEVCLSRVRRSPRSSREQKRMKEWEDTEIPVLRKKVDFRQHVDVRQFEMQHRPQR
jgi:hypothetical protein